MNPPMNEVLAAFRERYRHKGSAFWSAMTPFGFFADGFQTGRHAEHVAMARWASDCPSCGAPAASTASMSDQTSETTDAAPGLPGARSEPSTPSQEYRGWRCTCCERVNDGGTRCMRCHEPRPGATPARQADSMSDQTNALEAPAPGPPGERPGASTQVPDPGPAYGPDIEVEIRADLVGWTQITEGARLP